MARWFDYDPSRGKEIPLRLLEGFEGYLQSDGYAGYDVLCKKQNIVRLGYWDHARRKFTDEKKRRTQTKNKNSTSKVAKFFIALRKTGKLYAVERDITSLTPACTLPIPA
ncbi:MAG: transposase [Endozoicomonadaceae bacterium]|nr:transposase [Endozoicomonadaceae bacterium]